MEWNYLPLLCFFFLVEIRNTSSNAVQCPVKCDCMTGANNAVLVDCSRKDFDLIPRNITSSAKFVELSGNHLTIVENDSFPLLTDWQELFLDKNEILTIQAGAFQRMPNLTTLQLECNNLTEISGDYFFGLSLLQKLDISDNVIYTLLNDSFLGLSSLQLLKLGGNKLGFIPNGTFQSLPLLGYLHLQDNLLTVLEDGLFRGLFFLKYVNLSGNEITNIYPRAFSGNPQLSNLDLSFNNISSIPYLPNIPNLKSLNCDGNFISELTVTSLKYHQNLTTLSVNNNIIKILDYNIFEYLPELSDFSCKRNLLTWLDSRIGIYINRTKSIDLTHNLWKCDHHLQWIITQWNFSEDIFGNCSLPYELSGRPLTSLSLTDFFVAPRQRSELPSSYNFTSEEALQISCPVFSFPPANISWFCDRNGTNKTFSGTFVIEGVLGESLNGSLLFKKPTRSLAGKLWCLARNEIGEIALPVRLNYLQSLEEGEKNGQSATVPSNLVSEEPKVKSTSSVTYVVLSVVLLVAIALGSYGIFWAYRKIRLRRLGVAPSLAKAISMHQRETSYGCSVETTCKS